MEGVPLPFRATYPCRLGRCWKPKMGDQRATPDRDAANRASRNSEKTGGGGDGGRNFASLAPASGRHAQTQARAMATRALSP